MKRRKPFKDLGTKLAKPWVQGVRQEQQTERRGVELEQEVRGVDGIRRGRNQA